MSCRRVAQKTLVNNTGAATTTGTAVGRVRGLSSLLHAHIAVVYWAANRQRPAAFGGNTFDLFGWAETEDGVVQLGSSPINNDFAGDQQAPDGWEGTTALREIECRLAYTGLSGTAGKWLLVATVEPSLAMDDELFERLASDVVVSVEDEKTV